MRELTYRPGALAGLDDIDDRIEPDNPRRAASYVQDILGKCRLLLEHPQLGPWRGDIKPGLRIFPMFGKVVVCYRITDEAVVITRIFYGGQDYTAIMSEEGGD